MTEAQRALLERYKSRELVPGDESLLAEFKNSSKEFRDALDDHNHMLKALQISANEDSAEKQELRELLKSVRAQAAAKKRVSRLSWGVVSMVVLLAAIYFLLPIKSSTADHEELFTLFFRKADLALTLRGESSDLADFQVYYEQDKFVEAIEAFSGLDQKLQTVPVTIMLANCYQALGEPEEALTILKNASLKTNDALYQDIISWYSLLSYLQQGAVDKAYQMAIDLDSPSFTYSDDLKKLIEGLQPLLK